MAKLFARNPGAARFDRNERYETHRGFYHKDAAGRWRTPDGHSVAGQRKETATGRRGQEIVVYRSREAERYNERRHARLRAIDAANYLRARGHPATLVQTKRALGVQVRPKTRDRGARPREAPTPAGRFEGADEGGGTDGGYSGGGEAFDDQDDEPDPSNVHELFDLYGEEVPDTIDSWGDTP